MNGGTHADFKLPFQEYLLVVEGPTSTALPLAHEAFAKLGAKVVDVDLPDVDSWNAAATMIISAEAAALHGNWMRTRPQDYSPQVRARLEAGLVVPATSYIDSLRLRIHKPGAVPVAIQNTAANLAGSVAPSAVATFSFTVTAPAAVLPVSR